MRNFKLTVRSNILRTCIGTSMSLSRVTSLEITIEKDEKGDFVADSHSNLARWRKLFSQLLNTHGVNGVRQAEIQPL